MDLQERCTAECIAQWAQTSKVAVSVMNTTGRLVGVDEAPTETACLPSGSGARQLVFFAKVLYTSRT